MIRDVYVLKRTGEVLVHKAFSKRGVDEAIFSGFYSALSAFAEEMGHGGIETIQMGDVSFYYEHAKDLLFAIAADKSHDAKDVQIVLTEVKRQFTEEFANQIAEWDGNPTSFQKFGKAIELIVTAKRNGSDEDAVFSLPFALDGSKLIGKSLDDPEINGECILDSRKELAAVHLLLDDVRREDTDLKPLKEGCYEFIAKLLWPIWITKSADNRCLLIDGLKILRPQVARGFVPPASRYEALLNVNASPEYLAVMDKLTEEVKTAARSTPFDIHVVPADLAKLLQHLARISNGPDNFGVQLPSRISHNEAKKEATKFFAEAIETYKEGSTQWSQFQSYFRKNMKDWEARIQTEISTLEDHYENRKHTLKREIDAALTDLAKQEEKAMAEVDDWRRKQENNLIALLKTTLTPINEEIIKQQDTINQFLAEKKDSNLQADTFISQLNQTLEQFNSFATDLRNHSKETRRQIQQTQRELNELEREVQQRKSSVRQTFEAKEKEEIKRLDALQEEKEIRLQETHDRLKRLEGYASEIDQLVNEHISHSQQQLATFEEYLIDSSTSFPIDSKTPIYVPIYLAGLKRADDTTKLIIIPPLMVPPTKEGTSPSIGQQNAPVAALSAALVEFMKTPLETALATDSKFAKEVTRFSPRHNLLQDPHIESLLYSGLHALWQEKQIPERVHTQVKLACIDIYRCTNGTI